MKTYAATFLLFVALGATRVRADSATVVTPERVVAVRKTEAERRSAMVERARALDAEVAQLQREVRELARELAETPKYFDDPEDDELRP
jgi:hypothetical protein